jgi:hypothetical protein
MITRDQIKEKIEKAKESFKQNKTAYIAGGIGVVAGATLTYLITQNGIDIRANNVGDGTQIVNSKHVKIYQRTLERRGHPGNMIICNETGEIFASQNRAAHATGVNAGMLSQHLQGVHDHVKGLTFQSLGEMP